MRRRLPSWFLCLTGNQERNTHIPHKRSRAFAQPTSLPSSSSSSFFSLRSFFLALDNTTRCRRSDMSSCLAVYLCGCPPTWSTYLPALFASHACILLFLLRRLRLCCQRAFLLLFRARGSPPDTSLRARILRRSNSPRVPLPLYVDRGSRRIPERKRERCLRLYVPHRCRDTDA